MPRRASTRESTSAFCSGCIGAERSRPPTRRLHAANLAAPRQYSAESSTHPPANFGSCYCRRLVTLEGGGLVVVFRLTFSRSPASAAARADDAVNRLELARKKVESGMMFPIVSREYLPAPWRLERFARRRGGSVPPCTFSRSPASAAARADDAVNRLELVAREKVEPGIISRRR